MSGKVLHFPGLNGLRAIAAISVVISHITLGLHEFDLDPGILGISRDGKFQGLSLAGYGVSIFFVLSGFLITFLLQSEKKIHSINIKKFYIRRILRIWPLYYSYLLISLAIIGYLGLSMNITSLILYLFYAANIPFILGTSLPFLSHYWSLGVEEQFYLFWPWLVKKTNSLIGLTVGLISILLGTKIILHLFYPNSLLETIIHVTRFHCMMIGALGAIFYIKKNKLFLFIADNKLTQLICWILIFLVAVNKFHFISVIDNEIISVVALFIIMGQIGIKNRIINLEINMLDFLGKISYGIYMIHPLLIFLLAKILKPVNIDQFNKYILVYLVVLTITIFLAYLSYMYFERYFLNFKKKYVVVKSSGAKNS